MPTNDFRINVDMAREVRRLIDSADAAMFSGKKQRLDDEPLAEYTTAPIIDVKAAVVNDLTS